MAVHLATTDTEIAACFEVMRHLRDLANASAFVDRVRYQQQTGYQLAYLTESDRPLAVAGFRIGENLAWGRFLYVDDLVTLPEVRSRGHGSTLLAWLTDYARSKHCTQLHLDSGTQRLAAHQFYRRESLDVSSLHFKRSL
ncbi:MAG: GNAT family N-acetyltransferase [Cyanobacteria bacterium P01_D01_bin.123]